MASSLSSDLVGFILKKQATYLEKLISAAGSRQNGRAFQYAESLLHWHAYLISIRKLLLYCALLSPFRPHLQQSCMQREVADDHSDGILQICRKVTDINEVEVFCIVLSLQEVVLRIDVHCTANSIPVLNMQSVTVTHQVFKHWCLPSNVFICQTLMMEFLFECFESGMCAFFHLVRSSVKKCTWLHLFRQSHLKNCYPVRSVSFIEEGQFI